MLKVPRIKVVTPRVFRSTGRHNNFIFLQHERQNLKKMHFLTAVFALTFTNTDARSVADPNPNPDPDTPDPRVFGPPGSGSGSISQRYGSGSGSGFGFFYH